MIVVEKRGFSHGCGSIRPPTFPPKVFRMLSTRFVRLIEKNADEISQCLIETIRSHPDLPTLARESDAELRQWAGEILENLGYERAMKLAAKLNTHVSAH